MNVYSYFAVPIEYFNEDKTSFCLYPDNGDVLPLTKINNVAIIWSGFITRTQRDCYVCKAPLPLDMVVDMKLQTTDLIRESTFEYICNNYKELGEILVLEAAYHLNMETVAKLQINNIYAGRNLDDVYWLFPELTGLLTDIEIL